MKDAKQAQATKHGGAERWLAPGLLVLLALGVRAGSAWQTAAIFNDGPRYLQVAALFHRGDYAQALAHDYPPLYPLLISWLAPVVGDFALAGVVVSVCAGSLALLGLFAFLQRAFDRRVAVLGGLLFALHPYSAIFAGDVQSEGLYFAFFLGASALAWRAWMEEDAWSGAVAGALAGAAYLVRPEGLGVAAAAIAFGALRLYQARTTPLAFARVGGALALALVLVALPYVVYLHDASGEWQLTRKKSVRDLVVPEGRVAPDPDRGEMDRRRFQPPPLRRPDARRAGVLPARIDFEPRAVAAFFDLGQVAIGALHPLVVLLIVLGVASVRGPPGERGRFVIAVIGLYAVVLYGLALNVGYLDRRHVLAPLLLLLGYAALGLPVLGSWMLRALRPRRDTRGSGAGVWLAVGLFTLVTLPKTWAPHREDCLATRRAGEWLASRPELSGPVSASRHRTAWYAGEGFVHLARGGPEGDPAPLAAAGARFLIVDDAEVAGLARLDAKRAELRELYRVHAGGRTAWVFDLHPEPGS